MPASLLLYQNMPGTQDSERQCLLNGGSVGKRLGEPSYLMVTCGKLHLSPFTLFFFFLSLNDYWQEAKNYD